MVDRESSSERREGAYWLAAKLRKLREERGLTQKQVASAAGINESTVRNYELARRTPKPEHIDGLAHALDVAPEALIPFDDRADPNELFHMLWEIAETYGLELGTDEEFAYIAPPNTFFDRSFQRWVQAYEQMAENEEAFRDDYELWKDEFREHFNRKEYSSIYPDYDPADPASRQKWELAKFARALKEERLYAGLTQEELAEKSGISMYTLRSYEQGKRMPKEKQMEALCDALGISKDALKYHYAGSPNQAMHNLFALAASTYLTPVDDADMGPILRTNGNWVEWAIVRFAEEEDKVLINPSMRDLQEFWHWRNEFDVTSNEEEFKGREAGRITVNALTEMPLRA